MAQLPPKITQAIQLLSTHSGAASQVCCAVKEGRLSGTMEIRKLCTASGISQSQAGEVSEFLEKAQQLGLLERVSELNWRIVDVPTLITLAPIFQGIHHYRTEVHRDADVVEVVLTKPPNPSALTKTLEGLMLGTWKLYETRGVRPAIAEQAKNRFLVMTPFLDDFGGELLLSLYKNVGTGVKKQLILRMTPDGKLPEGYTANAVKLKELGVEVYNFRLEKQEERGTETFHAKVVLADHECAYVGSSNMSKWSFQYSLELGLQVCGRAADRIGQIADSIIKISTTVSF